jgi:putative cell wall-binding protein
MKKWSMLIVGVLALALMVGVGFAAAEDETEDVPVIADGRVNSWEVAAPVVIYCDFEGYSLDDGTEYSVMTQLDLYALPYSDGAWENIVSVSADDLADAMASEREESTLLAGSLGYGLYLNADDSLTAIAPGDAEGKVYTFSWNLGDQNC